MKKRKIKDIVLFSLMLLFIIGWTVLLLVYGPQELTHKIGVDEVYLTTFLLGVFGALASLTTFSVYPAMAIFVSGGANPLLITIVAGAGLFIGDSFFYLFGSEARELTSRGIRKKLDAFIDYLERKKVPLSVITYIYVAFTPFPNNVLIGGYALTGYDYKKLALPLLLGDFTLPLIVTFATKFGLHLF